MTATVEAVTVVTKTDFKGADGSVIEGCGRLTDRA